MLDMGFIEQVEDILKEMPSDVVSMLFSATMPDEVKNVSSKYMSNPINIDIRESEITAVDIEHVIYKIEEDNKFALLKDVTIIEKPESCIIFCNTKERVDMVYNRLSSLSYPCDKIHGGMEQGDRLLAMKRFRRGEFRYLIATDVVARGIDVDDISIVINYDIPLDQANYVHRTGRTGRKGRGGIAITFVKPSESKYLHDIETLIGFEIPIKEKPSKEEVLAKKPSFDAQLRATPQTKKMKSDELNKDIIKLRFNGG